MDEVILLELKTIAQQEGRLLQAVLEEAVKFYIEAKKAQAPRASVMAHFQASVAQNYLLGQRLAE